ncbi:hypothetical protein PanWU01x14_244590 [Parasponia andersonii]|uniref:Uncharacterized protein n=1 Tax=Parasponia andersonii TaxID=3476 RepID=A0A2P5BF13_PARAD|nr:hypothetical protein PanWU01x14_244590 [Parasponia andersonii]
MEIGMESKVMLLGKLVCGDQPYVARESRLKICPVYTSERQVTFGKSMFFSSLNKTRSADDCMARSIRNHMVYVWHCWEVKDLISKASNALGHMFLYAFK